MKLPNAAWLLLLTASSLAAEDAPVRPAVLASSGEIAAANRKADSQPWAKAARDRIIEAAQAALRTPLNIPDRGGQWPHWYSCKKDGARLVTDSPVRHRCPVCGAVYSGEPYDSVPLYGIHMRNSEAVRNLALAFRLNGKQEFADRAAAILTGYAARYESYPRHNIRGEDKVGGGKLMAQTLDESVWLIPVAQAYSLIFDQLTAGQRASIENNLLLPAANVIREHRMAIHNIQCWKNSAVGLVGFVTGRHELVDEAIDDPERGFRVQIARGVTDDGLWWEGSLGYHQYTLQALWPLAEAARHAGIDLYSERYAKMYDAPLALALPNGDAPGFNDNSGGNVARLADLYEIAFARWSRPAYGHLLAASRRDSITALLYGAVDTPRGPSIPEESELLGSAGFAMLRARGVAVAVRFGRHGGGHGHPDKLNIVTFGGGRLFGLDPGSINYGVPLHQEWYRSTIAHNTVAVDSANQTNTDGVAGAWTVDGKVTRFVASAGQAYDGVKLERDLRLSPDQLEDRFTCSSTSEHVYDWAFHAPGTLTLSVKTEPRPGPLGDRNGYQHIQSVARAATDGEWSATWDNGGVRMTIRFKAAPGTEVFTGIGPGRDPADKVPVVVVRRRATETVFDALHQFAARH